MPGELAPVPLSVSIMPHKKCRMHAFLLTLDDAEFMVDTEPYPGQRRKAAGTFGAVDGVT
jgi:hypothetical protein